MRKADLRMNEQYKYDVIKRFVDTNGNKKGIAMKMNCITRIINRIIIKYKQEEKMVLSIRIEIENPHLLFLMTLRTKYIGTNLFHFSRLLSKYKNIHISDTTINH